MNKGELDEKRSYISSNFCSTIAILIFAATEMEQKLERPLV